MDINAFKDYTILHWTLACDKNTRREYSDKWKKAQVPTKRNDILAEMLLSVTKMIMEPGNSTKCGYDEANSCIWLRQDKFHEFLRARYTSIKAKNGKGKEVRGSFASEVRKAINRTIAANFDKFYSAINENREAILQDAKCNNAASVLLRWQQAGSIACKEICSALDPCSVEVLKAAKVDLTATISWQGYIHIPLAKAKQEYLTIFIDSVFPGQSSIIDIADILPKEPRVIDTDERRMDGVTRIVQFPGVRRQTWINDLDKHVDLFRVFKKHSNIYNSCLSQLIDLFFSVSKSPIVDGIIEDYQKAYSQRNNESTRSKQSKPRAVFLSLVFVDPLSKDNIDGINTAIDSLVEDYKESIPNILFLFTNRNIKEMEALLSEYVNNGRIPISMIFVVFDWERLLDYLSNNYYILARSIGGKDAIAQLQTDYEKSILRYKYISECQECSLTFRTEVKPSSCPRCKSTSLKELESD